MPDGKLPSFAILATCPTLAGKMAVCFCPVLFYIFIGWFRP